MTQSLVRYVPLSDLYERGLVAVELPDPQDGEPPSAPQPAGTA